MEIYFIGRIKDGVRDFKIITPDGVEYEFTVRENCVFTYKSMTPNWPSLDYEYDAVHTWHLSKITIPGEIPIIYKYELIRDLTKSHDKKTAAVTSLSNFTDVGTGRPCSFNYETMSVMSVSEAATHISAYNYTKYVNRRILRSISSYTGSIEFTTYTSDANVHSNSYSYIREINVYNSFGKKVKSISLHQKDTDQSYKRKLLESIEIVADSTIIDRRTFFYADSLQKTDATDVFGYHNGKSYSKWYGQAVVSPDIDNISPEREYDFDGAMYCAMTKWVSATGAVTEFEFEPRNLTDSVPCYSRANAIDYLKKINPDSIYGSNRYNEFFDEISWWNFHPFENPHIGIRIKSINVSDKDGNLIKSRKFTYSNALSQLKLSVVGREYFIGRSGLRVSNATDVNAYKSANLLASSRGTGCPIENCNIFYGKVRETVSGKGIERQLITDYEFDLTDCQQMAKGINSNEIYSTDPLDLYLYSPFYTIADDEEFPNKFRGHRRTLYMQYVIWTFPEVIGAKPLLKKITTYRHDGSSYLPLSETNLDYIRSGSGQYCSGTHHYPLTCRTRGALFGQERYRYNSLREFNYFQTFVDYWENVCVKKTEIKYFPDGNKRERTTNYFFTGDSIGGPVNNVWQEGDKRNVVGVELSKRRLLNPFGADSLTRLSGKRLPIGMIITEAGHSMQHFTALSTQVSSGFFRTVADEHNLHTLPVAKMWVIDSSDTILYKSEYGKFDNFIKPTRISLGVPGNDDISVQRFNGYDNHGMPTGSELTGSPAHHYSWDLCDQLISVVLGNCDDGLKSLYTYDQLIGCTSIISPSGKSRYFNYKAGKLSECRNSDSTLLEKYEYELFCNNEATGNLIRSIKYRSGTPSINTDYYDSMGNPYVSVAEDFGKEGNVLTATTYDALGRITRNWMPIAYDGDIYNFSDGELSQLATESGYDSYAYPASAEAWSKSYQRAGIEFRGHPELEEKLCSNPDIKELCVKIYLFNDGKLELGRVASSYEMKNEKELDYLAGELDCTKSTDADGRVTLVFTDCLGRTVLTRAIADDGSFADTYVISNSWGDPLVVIPPAYAANLARSFDSYKTKINSMAYVYTYDGQHRLRSKKFPGVQEVEFVYDSEGRLAFSRDGNQRAAGVCSFRLYDAYGREALTGTCADRNPAIWNGSYIAPEMTVTGLTRKDATGTVCRSGYSVAGAVSALIPSAKLLTASYYDDYSAVPATLPSGAISQPRGLCTATLMATLGGDSQQQLLTVNYYDREERLIKSVAENLLQGDYTVESSYSPYGVLTAQRDAFTLNRNIGIVCSHSHSYSYDRFGRTLDVMLDFSGRSIRTLGCEYDNLGRLSRTWGYNDDLSCSISYNINGTATHRSTPFVTEDLWFGYGKVPQYSGKISGKDIYYGGNKQSYSYRYDKLGRLTEAGYSERENPDADYSASYSYDLEANPTGIKRMGLTDVGTYGVVNEIRADYRNGRPRSVVDAADAPILEGSLTGSGVVVKVTHTYDANGNLIKDATRGIDSIQYNVLNLPERIYFSNGYRLDYVYRADGVKLRETRRRPTFIAIGGSGGVITETTDYIGAYELEGGIPRRLNLPGGYMTIADTVYHHYIPDYQGNILAVVNTRTRQVEQRTDYYPYGMPHGSATGAGLNKRKYSGKELITFAGYDAMDYHARWRPTALPLFTTPDPLAEKYYQNSLYTYCGGDPINATDPSGCVIATMTTDNTYIWECINGVWGFYDFDGNAYDGGNDYIDKLTSSINILMSKSAGNKLVMTLAHDKRYVYVQNQYKNGFNKDSNTLSWNPYDPVAVPTTAGELTADIATILGHEFGHVDLIWNHSNEIGNVDETITAKDAWGHGSTTFSKTEIYATHIENMIRAEHGQPLRTHYSYVEDTDGLRYPAFKILAKRKSLYFDSEGKSTYIKLNKNQTPYEY